MPSSPRVSVIITTYNRAELLAQAVQSVLDQTFQDFELIVVDDGSSDDTAERARGFGERVRLLRVEHSGMPERSRNRGLAQARGELAAFLDDDDLWRPTKLAEQAAALDQSPAAGFAYTDVCFLSPDGSVSDPRMEARHRQAQLFFDHLLSGWSAYPSTLMIRREWIERLGQIDESPSSQGDFAYLLRLAHAVPATCVPLPLTLIRKHPQNLSQLRQALDIEHTIEILAAARRRLKMSARQRWLAARTSARLSCHLGLSQLRAGDKRGARGHFVRALQLYPLQRRPWLALLRSFP